MSNISIPITENGTTTLATAGKYCDKNVDVVVNVAGGGDEIPEEAFNITGNCSHLNYYGGWDWFFSKYGDIITTNRITDAGSMFSYSKLTNIPFSINLSDSCFMSNMFQGCGNLKALPDITGGGSTTYANYQFSGCNSVREIPQAYLDANVQYFASRFSDCFALNKIENLCPTNATLTSNRFTNIFNGCNLIKKFTFALDDAGACVRMWKSQTIDCASAFGWTSNSDAFMESSTGLTTATKVTDDASYQALKDNPDWWTQTVEYSRYNHDSAVETINSLPDTSAYGSNTIKFRGNAGSATDGGAINTLTADEIAVATAKGWTVTIS